VRYDIRLLYLVHTPLCPVPVSVRLPTGSCHRGCFFCCDSSWLGGPRFALKHILTEDDFLRLYRTIVIDNDFRFVWPQVKILAALKKNRVLRFVREELFEPSIPNVTKTVLEGCLFRKYGLLVKTSSLNVVNYIRDLKKIKHCIVFSVTDLLSDYKAKVEIINTCVGAGLNVVLSLKPIFNFNGKTNYILSSVNKNILGVEVGWLYGNPAWIPSDFLNRNNYKIVHCEKQYKLTHLEKVVSLIRSRSLRSGFSVRFYFASHFYGAGACCFVDEVFYRPYKA